MFVRTRVGTSNIFGQGLFAAEPVARGTVLCCFTAGAKVITEAEYLDGIRNDTHRVVRTGTRYVGAYFTIGNEDEPYTFINHSHEANLLCHVGIIIALRDLAIDDELTIDYRTLIDDTELGIWKDLKTGEVLRGHSARETLLRTARGLIDLVTSIDDWDGQNRNA